MSIYKNKISKLMICTCAVLTGFCGAGVATQIFAEDSGTKSIYQQGKQGEVHVSTPHDLIVAAKNIPDGGRIVLDGDIDLNSRVYIEASVELDLNNHTIKINGDNAALIIGKKNFSHREKYTIVHPGYWEWRDKVTYVNYPNSYYVDIYGVIRETPVQKKVTRVEEWIPETTETKYKDVYVYDEDMDVLIKNGTVSKSSGVDGTNGKECSWFGCHGENGTTPCAPVEMISGALRLQSAVIVGGDGGNGGNGGYRSMVHLPIAGGGGGDGGDGGNGGPAVKMHRAEARIIIDKNSSVLAGNIGHGGKGGKASSEYWFYSSSDGNDGTNGYKERPVIR